MNDFTGNALKVGDDVVYCYARGSSSMLTRAKVLGFTKKLVKIEFDRYGRKSEANVYPEKLVRYVEVSNEN